MKLHKKLLENLAYSKWVLYNRAMSDDLSEILDGLALFQEYAPASAEDWIAVARRFNADNGDRSESSPLFAALSLAIEQQEQMLDLLEEAVIGGIIAEGIRQRLLTFLHERDRLPKEGSDESGL